MNRWLKKTLAVALICSMSLAWVAPRKSEGFMGGTAIVISMLLGGTTTQAWLLLGGAVVATAASVSGGIEFISKARSSQGARKALFWVVALGAIAAGGLILDGSQAGQGMQLASIDAVQADRLGLSAGEHAAYESELDFINGVNEEALARMGREFGNSKPSLEAVVESLHRNWHELARGALSPEAIRAVQKMGARR